MLDVVRGRRGPRPVSFVLRVVTAAVVLLLGLPTPQAFAAGTPTITGPLATAGGAALASTDSDSTPVWEVTPATGAAWCWSGPGDSSAVPALPVDPDVDAGAWSPCPAELTTSLTDGDTWTVTAADWDTGTWTTATPSTYTYAVPPPPADTTAPVVTVADLPTGSGEQPSWTVDVDDPTATLACAVVGPAGPVTPVTCGTTASVDLADDPQGLYTLTVTATDAATNAGSDTATYTLDRDAGTVTVSSAPGPGEGGAGTTATNTWTVDASGAAPGSTVACSLTLDGTPLTAPACSATTTTVDVDLVDGDGTYRLTVTADDGLGAPTSAAADFVLDRTDPVVTVTSAPAASGSTAPLDWSWTVTEANPVAQTCALTVGATPGTAAPCTGTTYSVATPVDGETYTLEVVVTDAVGRTGSAQSGPHAFDGNAPSVSVSLADDADSSAQMPAATATSDDPTATVTCVVTDPLGNLLYPAGPCSGVEGLPLTDDGVHTVTASATDGVNTATSAPATYVLDRVAPDAVTITTPASPTGDETATWSVSALEAGAVRTCWFVVDGDDATPAFGPCPSPLDFPAAASGSYELRVSDEDPAGNVTVTGSAPVVLDETPPATPAFTTPLPAYGSQTSHVVDFGLAVSDPDATFECQLTGPAGGYPWQACSSMLFVAFPEDGAYLLSLRAVDLFGNPSGVVTTAYTRDAVVPPAPTSVTGPADPADDDPDPTWSFAPDPATTGDDIDRAVCELRRGDPPFVSLDPCTSPVSFGTLADGTYEVAVTFYDLAGNASSTVVSGAYTLDTADPLAPVVTALPGPSPTQDQRIEWTWTHPEDPVTDGRFECLLATNGSPTPAAGTWSTCTSPHVLTDAADASYVLHVRLVDVADNVGPHGSAAPYVVDTGDPDQPVLTVEPTGPSPTGDASWSFTGDADLSCALVLGTATPAPTDYAACASPLVRTDLGHGTWYLHVKSTDAARNESVPAVSVGFVVDREGPEVVGLTGPTGPDNDPAASWAWSGETGATAECRLLRGTLPSVPTPTVTEQEGWADCTAPFDRLLPGDGSWTLEVRLTDVLGNTGPVARATYLLKVTIPTLSDVSGPAGPSNVPTPVWEFSSDGSTECRLVSTTTVGAWSPCGSPTSRDLSLEGHGDYRLEVIASDGYGNSSALKSSPTYAYDVQAPAAPVVASPDSPGNDPDPSFTWASEADEVSQCRVRLAADVGADTWVTCTSGYAPLLPSDGIWVLDVRLRDVAGNTGVHGTSAPYLLDTALPDAPVVTPPAPTGRDRLPTWGVVAEVGSTLECSVSGDGLLRDWAPCQAPFDVDLTSPSLTDGTYVLSVRATDEAGNTGPVGSGSYVLDTVAPGVPVVTVAPLGRSTSPTFSFTAEPGTTAVCRLSFGGTLIGSPFGCVSPVTVDLADRADGPYNLNVRVVDAAGNTGFGGLATYVLDRTPPATPVFVVRPANPSPDRRPVWEVRIESGTTLGCDVLFPTGAVRDLPGCASPVTVDLGGLPEGTYTLRVRAVDAAGNTSPVVVDAHELDLSALAVPVVTPPPSPSADGRPTWRFTVPTGTTGECRLTAPDGGVVNDWGRCDASFTATLFGLADGPYRLGVRARSAAGASAAAVAAYVYDTTRPAAPTVQAPPSPSTVAAPVFIVSAPDLQATAECRLLRFGAPVTDWVPCPVSPAGSQHLVVLDSDGSYALEARITDGAGNVGPAGSASYVLNRDAAPGVSVTGPPSPGSDATPTWELVSGPGTTLECRVTGPTSADVVPLGPCTSPFTVDLENLPDGAYALTVHAVTAAGAVGPDTTTVYELSRSAPGVPSDPVGPSGEGAGRQPSWTFTLPTGATGALCTVYSDTDQATPFVRTRCDSGTFVLDLTRAPDASYTLTVVALSPSGVESEPSRPVTYTLVTRVAPAPVFTLEPGSPSSTLDPTWRFTHEGRSAECRLLAAGVPTGGFTACTSPRAVPLGTRPDGRYTLEVRAVNVAGAGPAASSDYVLDRTALPLPVVTSVPATPGRDTQPAWTFTGPAGLAAECSLLSANGPYTPCTGSFRLSLAGDGTHRIGIRLVDGTRTGAAVTGLYELDTTAPAAPSFTLVPAPSPGKDTTVAWGWSLPTLAVADCQASSPAGTGSWTVDCGTRRELRITDGRQGAYATTVRSRDRAGNTSPETTSSYVLDTTAPVLESVRPPASPGTDTTPTWGLGLPAGLRSATCTTLLGNSIVGEPASCLSGRYDMPLGGAAPGAYRLQVVLVDAAGNRSSTTAGSYELRGSTRGTTPVTSRPEPVPGLPPAGGAPGGGSAGPGVALPRPDGPDPEGLPRAGAPVAGDRQPPASPTAPVRSVAPGSGGGNALADGLQVPGAIADAVSDTFKKPQLPLALLVVVVLFLLVQNRIDRRDPKLAGAEPDTDDELAFGPAYRPGGAPA